MVVLYLCFCGSLYILSKASGKPEKIWMTETQLYQQLQSPVSRIELHLPRKSIVQKGKPMAAYTLNLLAATIVNS